MTREHIKQGRRITLLDDFGKHQAVPSTFDTTDHPNTIDTMAAIVLALAELGLVNLYYNARTTYDGIVFIQRASN